MVDGGPELIAGPRFMGDTHCRALYEELNGILPYIYRFCRSSVFEFLAYEFGPL